MSNEKPRRHKPKKDNYARKRGASQLFDLHCRICDAYVVLYQKDGPGALKRLYLDRIFEPEPQNTWRDLSLSEVSNLTCPSCKALIGTPMLYQPEQRKALRLIPGMLKKMPSNGSSPTIQQKG